MPLPWKKTRVGRISKMVADLQSPQRRGGSMVVQTGFPTSLIDLFVKNRDRLRKRSKKNKNSDKRSDFDSVDSVSDHIVSCSEKCSEDVSISVVSSSGEIENEQDSVPSPDEGRRSEVVVEDLGRRSSGDLRSVSIGFTVVVLALCITKFAVGITIAAFLLLFLECVGKHFSCLQKPYLNVKSGLECMARRVGYAVLVLRSDVVVKEKSDGVVFELVEPGVETDSSFEEIEVVEVESSVCSDEGFSRSGTECFDGSVSQKSLYEYLVSDDEKLKKVETGDQTDDSSVSVCEKSKGRRKFVRKIGVKLIKKFVSQKLSKKHESGTELDPKPSSEVCDSMAAEGLVEQEGKREEEEESENSSMLLVNSVNKSEKQEANGIVTSVIVEKKGTESKENFGYLILFLIALVGLVGGRVLALMLIITWCFMLKVISSWSRSGFIPFSMKRCS